ncbi:hypothetical protein [Cereibacter changlensis]|uniref:hypothetical protein n=1 Tax=Cereibacter changlensis TaxID=402884 RepID=UPI004034201E
MASRSDPAFPVPDFARIMASPGLDARELYVMHMLAAQVANIGAHNVDQAHIDRCGVLADMALSHRSD